MHIYKSREKSSVDISKLINEIRKIKTLEKNIATSDTKKLVIYNSTYKTVPHIEYFYFFLGRGG